MALEQITAYLTWQSLAQILIVATAVVSAFLVKRGVEYYLVRRSEQKPIFLLEQFYKVLSPAFRPIVAFVLLIFLDALTRPFVGETRFIVEFCYELIILWGFVRLVQFSTDNRAIIYACGITGLLLILVYHFGNFSEMIAFLDRYSFTLGQYKFSIVKLVKAIVAFGLLLWVATVSIRFVRFFIGQFSKLRSSSRELTIKGAQILIYFVLFMVALDVVGIDLTALAVFGGALGVGLGFGLQKITSNFISGLILLFEKTFEVNDVVELENGVYGHVRYIGARYTMVETRDGKEVLIPNEEFITTKVTNWTHTNKTGRIMLDVGVSYYTENLEQIPDIILASIEGHPRLLKNPAPRCLLDSFGASSVDFKVQFWIDDVSYRYSPVKSEVMMLIWKAFRENNIDIPFPQRDLHLKSVDAEIFKQLKTASKSK